MAVQAVFLQEVGQVRALRYLCSHDGSMLFALDCQESLSPRILTFEQLRRELGALCWWQLRYPVMIGYRTTVVDVLTIYHAFEFAHCHRNTLMLVSTPPDEYFDPPAA